MVYMYNNYQTNNEEAYNRFKNRKGRKKLLLDDNHNEIDYYNNSKQSHIKRV